MAIRIVGPAGFNDIVARGFGIFHQVRGAAAAVAIDEHVHEAAVVPRQVHFAGQPVSDLLALVGAVVERSVAGSVDFIEVFGAEEDVIHGQIEGVVTTVGDWVGKTLMVGAAGIFGANVVNSAKVSVNEGAENALIAEDGAIDPSAHVVGDEPLAVSAETARDDRVAEANQGLELRTA